MYGGIVEALFLLRISPSCKSTLFTMSARSDFLVPGLFIVCISMRESYVALTLVSYDK